MSLYYVLASFILTEKSVSLKCNMSFFLFTFKIISLSLVFSSLTIMCLGMAFFVFVCFVSPKFFYIWGLNSFFSFGHFQFIFLLYYLSLLQNVQLHTYWLFSISSLVVDILVGFCGGFFPPWLQFGYFPLTCLLLYPVFYQPQPVNFFVSVVLFSCRFLT